jgi:hypothetical protein
VLSIVDELARKASIKVILDSGTLLGLVREGGLLPGDTDLDFALTSRADMASLIDVLPAQRTRFWKYSNRIYKVELDIDIEQVTYVADFKVFLIRSEQYFCPSIGSASGSRRMHSGLKSRLLPLWKKFVAAGDATRLPWNLLTRVDSWVIPAPFFDTTIPISGYSSIVSPAQVDDYLAYRYGDWATPVSDWTYRRDDGAYRSNQPEALRAWLANRS